MIKGIGYSFLARMLRSKDSPDGCPRLMFQSVALSVLSCFAQDEEIMTHPSVSFLKVGKSQNQIFLITIFQKKRTKVFRDSATRVSIRTLVSFKLFCWHPNVFHLKE